MKTYLVYIGNDQFQVEAEDSRKAAAQAARLFRERYDLNCSLSDITYYASTKLTPAYTTQEVLSALKAG